MVSDTKVETFECSLLRGTATVIITHAVHYSSRQGTKEPDKMGQVKFDCENANDCGVMDQKGGFDWTKCVHPRSPRRPK